MNDLILALDQDIADTLERIVFPKKEKASALADGDESSPPSKSDAKFKEEWNDIVSDIQEIIDENRGGWTQGTREDHQITRTLDL